MGGTFADAVGAQENVDNVDEALAETWEGSAHQACYVRMNTWYKVLSTESEIAEQFAAFLHDTAENVEAACDMIVATLNPVIDILLSATKVLNAIKALRKAKEATGVVKKIGGLIKEHKEMRR